MNDRKITKLTPIPKLAAIDNKLIRKKRVAAYARVSTDNLEQQTSFSAQVDYYTKLIAEHLEWEFVKVYADEGVSGCRTNKREGFMEMIADCEKGLIDLILTKSVSRFARNTVDSITTIRNLKNNGIGIYFEKENIFTLDSKGEFLITLMSSLAQEESRSISENVCWGQRKRFADGKSSLAYSRFLGYDKGAEKYQMVVNEEQAVTIRRIFRYCLQGYTPDAIAMRLTADGILTPASLTKWSAATVRRILSNEKYKGDALLQKEFTIDFLKKKTKKNCGELPQYYVEGDHEAIIAPWLFDYVQEQISKRGGYTAAGRYSGVSLYCSKIICGKCGNKYGLRPWHSTSYNNPVWQCRSRYSTVRCKTVNIYDMYLHFITHSVAIRKIKKTPSIKKKMLECVSAVVGQECAAVIRKAINRYLRSDVWDLWADEDDLVLIIDRIVTQDSGELVVYWIDGSVDEFQMERFSPKHKKWAGKFNPP
ncbi:MAG: recombinase family protein [Ruminococcus sp.]|nr:recombinase family protein [Ruminococcus sp.]